MSVAAKGAGTISTPAPRAVDELAADAPIITRIAAVMADCRRIEKSAVNDQQGYSFAPEGEMTEMLRPLMAAAGLVLHSTIEHVERYPVQFRNSAGTGITVHVRYTLHGPNDSAESSIWQGDATDNADKALPKALTAAKKSYLVATFLLSTGADPDAGGEVSTRPAPPPGPPAPDRPASSAQVRRAFAIAGNGDPIIPQNHVRLLARLLTRTHDEPLGRSIHELTMAEMREVYAALDRYRAGEAAYYEERLGKMAALLDRERVEDAPAPASPEVLDALRQTIAEPPSTAELEEIGPEPAPDPFGAESDDDIPF